MDEWRRGSSFLPFLLSSFLFVLPGSLGPSVVPARQAEPGAFLIETEASARVLDEGRQALLDFRLAEAAAHFDWLAARPDGGVAGLHFRAYVDFLEALVTDDAPAFDAFFARADTLLDRLGEAPEGPWRSYLTAEVQLRRAVAHAKLGHYVRAALGARSAYAHYTRAVQGDPSFHEPYQGLGLMHLAIGSLPAGYRRFLKLFGYRGDVEQGLRELRRAAGQSRYNREESAVLVALAEALLYRAPERALPVLERLHGTHPNSPLFAHLYGFLLFESRRAAEAEVVLRRAVRAAEEGGAFYVSYVDHFLARALFVQNRFAEAERYYRSYLARQRTPTLRATSYLGLGLSLEMQGRRAEAEAAYRAVEAARDFDSDAAAYRAACLLLEAPMDERERVLLLGRNAFDAGHYAEAEARLRPLFADQTAPADARSEAAYRLGRVAQVQEHWDEALEYYAYAVRHPVDERARWAPWSQFYIGEIYAVRGDADAAEQAYRAALAYPATFDYNQALEQGARAGLARLR